MERRIKNGTVIKYTEWDVVEIDEHGDSIDPQFYQTAIEGIRGYEKQSKDRMDGSVGIVLQRHIVWREADDGDLIDEEYKTIIMNGSKTALKEGNWLTDQNAVLWKGIWL